MKNVLKVLTLLLVFSLILSGCAASGVGNESSTPESEESRGTEGSTEGAPAPLSYSVRDYFSGIEDFQPLVIHSAEEFSDYCSNAEMLSKYDDAFFENNSLILVDYMCGSTACGFAVEDLEENGDGTVTLACGYYAAIDIAGAAMVIDGGYLIEVNRVLTQDQVHVNIENHEVTGAEFKEKFGDKVY